MSPGALMSSARVPVDPGGSIVVNVKLVARDAGTRLRPKTRANATIATATSCRFNGNFSYFIMPSFLRSSSTLRRIEASVVAEEDVRDARRFDCDDFQVFKLHVAVLRCRRVRVRSTVDTEQGGTSRFIKGVNDRQVHRK